MNEAKTALLAELQAGRNLWGPTFDALTPSMAVGGFPAEFAQRAIDAGDKAGGDAEARREVAFAWVMDHFDEAFNDDADHSKETAMPSEVHLTDERRRVRHGTARHGTARQGTARHGTARHGTAPHRTARLLLGHLCSRKGSRLSREISNILVFEWSQLNCEYR